MDPIQKKEDYFSNRNVNESSYQNFSPPSYFLAVLPALKDSRILDIGCGLGQFLEYFQEQGYKNVEGIDISAEAVAVCLKKNLAVTKIDNIHDFRPTSNHKYDFVIMNHVLEHIEKDEIINTLVYIKNELLGPKGVIFIAVPNAQAITGMYWRYEDFTHTTIFTTGSLFYVLKAAGFNTFNIVDPSGLAGSRGLKRLIKQGMLSAFKVLLRTIFMVTGATFHKPSPPVYTWELKILAG